MSPANEPPRDLPDRVIRSALRHPANLCAFSTRPSPPWLMASTVTAAACSIVNFPWRIGVSRRASGSLHQPGRATVPGGSLREGGEPWCW
jgi:hypothetical protein